MAKFARLHYDVHEIPIADVVREIVNVEDLETLEPSEQVATRETDQATAYHKLFYDKFDRVQPLYRKLAATLLGTEADDFYIQQIPTFRVHLRNSVAVGSWHRDSDFGHEQSETNYWVPLTRAFGNNTLWIDNEPAGAEYGDVVVFDGANSWHGNKVNDTAISRVSMDFRTIPRKAYRATGKRSVSHGMPFLLGEYWGTL
ncbi:hypothetical protein ABZ942_41935 [Nocardia sp. NPDC046473]|uniref:hypothetical protein n=1 Tax=Nocardia sp. NPDC046473 TaxID=3155733 RepID=UPI0033FC7DB8